MSEPLNNDLESLLRSLRPAGQVQRDLLLYRAGQASARRHGWLWPAATAAMTVTAATLLVMLAGKEEPRIIERVVYVTVPQPVQPTVVAEEPRPAPPAIEGGNSQPDPNAYWVLREQILRGGVESLPRPAAVEYATGPPQTLGSMMMSGVNGKDF